MQVPTYVLDLGTNGRVVFLMGEIDHGITKSLEALIDKNPDVTDIVLESRGGNPFEARVPQTDFLLGFPERYP